MSLNNDHAALVIRAFKGISSNPDQCFTCFDVTKATRSLTDDNIRHHEVRELVHALFDQGLLNVYSRIDHTFYDAGNDEHVTAKLFVPPTGDPYAYDPNEVKMVKAQQDDEEPDVLLEDEEGKPLISVGPAPKDDDANTVSGIDDEVITVHTDDSVFNKILKKVAKLPKWW